MNNTTPLLIGALSFVLAISCGSALAAANSVAAKNQAQTNAIEKLIRQHIALGRLKNNYFHPIIAKNRARPTRNPFANLPKQAVANLTKAGINVNTISRYKAIRFSGQYLGSQSRKIVHTEPNVVLVIAKGTRTHDPIFSRGPVYMEGQADDVGSMISSNLVWFDEKTNSDLPQWGHFIGMPTVIRGGSQHPRIVAAPQYKLNKLVQERRSECQSYAKQAVQHNTQNRQLQCGFTGSRWNNNQAGQYNWCMTVLDPVTLTETGFREDSLKKCQANKTNPKNAQNRPAIPAQCNDPSKQYGAVKQINHAFRYDRKPSSPIEGGLIRYDYNRDKRQDYVFLEAKGDNSRVVICMSNGANYQRRVTDIKIYSGTASLGSYEHRLSQSGANLDIVINYFEHNAGSASASASYRYQPGTKRFKIIKRDSSTYGVEQDGFTYPMSAPQLPNLY